MSSRQKNGKPIFLPGIHIDRHKEMGLSQQLEEHIKEKIALAVLQKGDRLPSIRQLSFQLQISADTVQAAYSRLLYGGWIRSKDRSGFFVETPLGIERGISAHSTIPEPTPRPLNEKLRKAAYALSINTAQKIRNRPFACYAYGSSERISKKRKAERPVDPLATQYHKGYSDPFGYLPLRRTISLRLRQTRGVLADPDQIIITSGTVQSLALCARLLFEPGGSVWIEDPCLPLFSEIFSFSALKTIPIPVDQDGLIVEQALGDAPRSSGVVVSPSCQFPYSTTLSKARREALIEWANQENGWIIEDDTENLFAYDPDPLPPILSFPSAKECTIYMNSFSLFLYPGIRLGYIVTPKILAESFAGAKLLSDRQTPVSPQAALADFMESSVYERHLKNLINTLKVNKEILTGLLEKYLKPYVKLLPCQYGSHLTVLLDEHIRDTKVAEKLDEAGITALPLSGYCRRTRQNGLTLGIAHFSAREVEAAGKKLVEVVLQMEK